MEKGYVRPKDTPSMGDVRLGLDLSAQGAVQAAERRGEAPPPLRSWVPVQREAGKHPHYIHVTDMVGNGLAYFG